MDLDLDMSIPDRNVELETKLLNQYYNEFVDNYISKIVKLDSHPDFIRDDSFPCDMSNIFIVCYCF